eukprot:scaffold13866_cov175-Amphora_coffeaeformis.AAC.2
MAKANMMPRRRDRRQTFMPPHEKDAGSYYTGITCFAVCFRFAVVLSNFLHPNSSCIKWRKYCANTLFVARSAHDDQKIINSRHEIGASHFTHHIL